MRKKTVQTIVASFKCVFFFFIILLFLWVFCFKTGHVLLYISGFFRAFIYAGSHNISHRVVNKNRREKKKAEKINLHIYPIFQHGYIPDTMLQLGECVCVCSCFLHMELTELRCSYTMKMEEKRNP